MKKPRAYVFFRIFLCLLYFTFSITLHSQLIHTIAGSGHNGNTGNNGPAICAGIPYTSGICLDGKGNLYLTCSNSIRKVNFSSGIITNVAGSDSYGHTGDGGPALNATMQYPTDICMDGNGNLYISERGSDYIRKINTNTGIISTIAGTGSEGYSGDGGPALSAMIYNPAGIDCDAAGNIYFADKYNSRIRKIDVVTGIITTVAGTGSIAHSGDGGLAINAGTPYPVDVSIDANGHLFFIEVYNVFTCRVRRIDKNTGIITTVAGMSSYAYSGDGGPATAASLFDPSGLFVDAAGNVFISEYDDSRIRKVDAATGIINTIAGNGINGFAGDGGAAINATLHYPMGIEADNNGDIYFADNTNHRIRKITNTITVPVTNAPTINITASTTAVCPGTEVKFTAATTNEGSNPVYIWMVNGSTVGSNSSTFTSSSISAGDNVTCRLLTTVCNNIVPVQSNVITFATGSQQTPAVEIRSTDTSICEGANIVFTATPQNAGTNPSYQWLLNGSNTGSNSPTFSSSTLVNGDQISCVLTVDASYTCASVNTTTSGTIIMEVADNIVPEISITASDNSICAGSSVSFTAIAQNAGTNPTYQWFINSTPVGSNQSGFTSTVLQDDDIITCEILPSIGACSNTAVRSLPVIMQVNSIPVITLNPADTIINPASQVQIQANISGNITSFQWAPSSLLVSSSSSNALTVPLSNDAAITLSVVSPDGCSATATSILKISLPFYIPTAFTPNNDGLNDVFRIPPNIRLNLRDFSIYDRWGNRIFQTSDISKGWDGTQGGVKKDSGVFIYIISGSDEKGPVLKKGSFTLIR